jgi:hypothetical protein
MANKEGRMMIDATREDLAKAILSGCPGWFWALMFDPPYVEEEAPEGAKAHFKNLNDVLEAGYLPENALPEGARAWADQLIDGLLDILVEALARKNPDALRQLYAIEKLIHPAQYEVPRWVINEIADKYETNAAHARAYDVRRWMARLARVVKPAKNDGRTVFDGPVVLAGEDVITKQKTKYVEIAERHWQSGTHLETLAMKAYMEALKLQCPELKNHRLSIRSLKADMSALEAWEERHPEDVGYESVSLFAGPDPGPGRYPVLPLRDHSLGWVREYLKRSKT